jgi:hypothetical protein
MVSLRDLAGTDGADIDVHAVVLLLFRVAAKRLPSV